MSRWVAFVLVNVMCVTVATVAACRMPSAQTINQIEAMACVFAAAELPEGDTAELIAALCNVPVGDVVAWLGAKKAAKQRLSGHK